MNQSQRVLSTYAADLFGISSALYELGGLIVMHDASGCNSTYGTHDEPRWYDTPSMVYISGLNEVDTIYGSDRRLRENIREAALAMQPRFIAVSGSPMPNVIGSDLRALAKLLEEETGIPTLGFRTDGIHSYVTGAGEAFLEYAKRFAGPHPACADTGVNILGVTPLDFSVVGNSYAMRDLLAENKIRLVSLWAMGSGPEELAEASSADVNLVVSASGLAAAAWMEAEYGIPYLVMTPVGKSGAERWIREIRALAGVRAEADPARQRHCDEAGPSVGAGDRNGSDKSTCNGDASAEKHKKQISSGLYGSISCFGCSKELPEEAKGADVLVIGEPVIGAGIESCLRDERGIDRITRICPLPDVPGEVAAGAHIVTQEQHLRDAVQSARLVIADPIYARLDPRHPDKFIRLPHEAYSGRHYRDEMPGLIGGDFSAWLTDRLKQV